MRWLYIKECKRNRIELTIGAYFRNCRTDSMIEIIANFSNFWMILSIQLPIDFLARLTHFRPLLQEMNHFVHKKNIPETFNLLFRIHQSNVWSVIIGIRWLSFNVMRWFPNHKLIAMKFLEKRSKFHWVAFRVCNHKIKSTSLDKNGSWIFCFHLVRIEKWIEGFFHTGLYRIWLDRGGNTITFERKWLCDAHVPLSLWKKK